MKRGKRLAITLAHGGGGREGLELIRKMIVPAFSLKRVMGGIGLEELEDGASIPLKSGGHLVISMDSYTVKPIFFSGGDIGKLAAAGSINDVAVMGAEPLALLDGIVAEEGFSLDDLERIISSMELVLAQEGVALIGGDFKVVPRRELDGLVVSTVAVGIAQTENLLRMDSIRPGDRILVSGTIGEHGAAILAAQEGLGLKDADIRSDVAPITKEMRAALSIGGVRAAKDPTRGGLAMSLNDFAESSGLSIFVEEELIPIRDGVRRYSEMLGIDVLSLASEGRAVMAVDPAKAGDVLSAIRDSGCEEASMIGEAREGRPGFVILRTLAGGLRLLERPSGELVPRIC